MAGKIISIEIGYSLTRICEVDYKAKTHRIYRNVAIPTPDGVFSDGVLLISPEYVDALKKAMTANKIKAKQVMFTITSAKIASREVVIPFVKENRIADVVAANAADYFPVDLSQYQLAYSILGTIGETKGTQQYKLLVMAAPTAMLAGYYDLAKALKLELAAIDYAGNSIYQLVKQECAQGTSLIVKIDGHSTLVMALLNGVIDFTRNVSYGVDEAVDTVMELRQWGDIQNVQQALQVMAEHDCLILEQPENAQAVQESAQLKAEDEYFDEEDEYPEEEKKAAEPSARDRAMSAVTDAMQPLISGIGRVVDYYVSHNSNRQPDRVIITGLGSDIRGIDDLLAKEINHPVEVLKNAAGWNLEKDFKTPFYGGYIACAGAAVAPVGFKKDTDKKGKKDKDSGKGAASVNGALIAWCLFAVGLVVAICLAVFSLVRYVGTVRTNMQMKAQESELEEIIPIYNEFVQTTNTYNQVTAMYEATENRNDELYDFITELEEKLPADVSVVSFTSESESVTMNMNVPSKEDAAAVAEQLRTFESLIPESVTISSLVVDEDEESGSVSVNFTVVASYHSMDYEPESEESTEVE
jgi:type IV pilus assembly protein PilM